MHPAAKAHLVAQLAEQSRRSARLTTCPRCGAEVLAGDDHDKSAHRATVDLDPVDRAGEMLAVLAGRATYDLAKSDGKPALYYREPWNVNDDRPPKWPVHVAHKCERQTLL